MSPRAYRVAVLAILGVHAVMVALVAWVTPWVTDEPAYLRAGMAIRKYLDWEVFETILHGPVPLLANQLFADWAVPTRPFEDYIFWGRLGLLPFSLACGWFLARLVEQAIGRVAALAALVLHCFNPIILANASLMTCDMGLTCCYLIAVYAAWRYLAEPGFGRLCLMGVSLGVALATKYYAVFLVPVLGLAALAETLRGFRPGLAWSRSRDSLGARLADLIPVTFVCAVIALLTLHTCYLWQAGGYVVQTPPEGTVVNARDPNAGPLSALLVSMVEFPLVPELLQLLPEPYVRGIDFQQLQQGGGKMTVFGDHHVAGHPAFFATSLAVKLPLATLLLLVFGIALRRPRLAPRLGVLLWGSILLPFVYVSFFSALQMGVRYVLPVLPLLCVFGGRAVQRMVGESPWRLTAGRITAAACGLGLLVFHVGAWPYYANAFNTFASERPYLLFTGGTNLSWPTGHLEPPAEILRRHPDAVRVGKNDGPRLGTCLVYGRHLGATDARDGGRIYHWLRRFHPVDRLGPWFVFDASEPEFRAAVGADTGSPDPRGLVELAVALLVAGRPADAEACLAGSTDLDAEAARQAVQHARAGESGLAAYVESLLHFRRADAIIAMGSRVSPAVLARAHYARTEMARVAEILEREAAARALTPNEVLMLLFAYRSAGERQKALSVLDRYMPAPGDPAHAVFSDERVRLLSEIALQERRPDLELR